VTSHPGKLRTLDELGEIAARARADGRRIVQAHGAFDLMHVGHVRHLEAARRLGDVLLVTITADRFLKKGPGRPVFTASLRAEALAALQCVDWVAVVDDDDAVGAIQRIRPGIYVKGPDYVNAADDVTGKISLERAACEAGGGRVHFTDDAVFSSSGLINRHLDVFGPELRAHLDRMRGQGALGQLLELMERVRDHRVLVVGDAIVDDYQYVEPMQKTPKEHLIATRHRSGELFAGGVFAVANHVSSFCRQVDVVTCLGELDRHEDLVRQSLRPNVALHALTRPGAPTTLKRRFVDPAVMRKLFEVHFMHDEPLPAALQSELDARIAALAPACDLVIVADFGHGLLAPSTIASLTGGSRFLAVTAQTNSANYGYNLVTRYPRADYVCIDEAEARLAASDRLGPLAEVARRLIDQRVDCSKIIVTRGRQGCVTLERGQAATSVPAFAGTVVDTLGAGDAFLAVTAPLVAAGGALDDVGFVGNVVGALEVAVVGHRRWIERAGVIKAVTSLLK
jgi:rfaE bifunctional protein nucleotidyltransferase chain/domain